jgi:ABC-type lipoprotein release transport system permease subunit
LLSPGFNLLTYRVDAEREFGTLKNISGWIIALGLASSYSRITAHPEMVMHGMRRLIVYLKLMAIMLTVLIEFGKSAVSGTLNPYLD